MDAAELETILNLSYFLLRRDSGDGTQDSRPHGCWVLRERWVGIVLVSGFTPNANLNPSGHISSFVLLPEDSSAMSF
jgi:hypothetical protein